MITVLRNRAYLEIYYRGNWYPAPHDPLITTDLFDRAQAILAERCEDRSRRASNPAEYLLTGRIRCGQAYVGTAAHGHSGRYTYYTCFHPGRYGTKHCANDLLPAEQLEQAVTRRLWKLSTHHNLIDRAITDAYERVIQRDDEQHAEIAAMQRKLTETAPRWTATSARSRPAPCPRTPVPRIAALSEEVKALEARAAELAAHENDEQPERPHPLTSTFSAARYAPR